ncbi:hypothetical protein EI94DRAFT_1739603, partial [Lactarius quietus]
MGMFVHSSSRTITVSPAIQQYILSCFLRFSTARHSGTSVTDKTDNAKRCGTPLFIVCCQLRGAFFLSQTARPRWFMIDLETSRTLNARKGSRNTVDWRLYTPTMFRPNALLSFADTIHGLTTGAIMHAGFCRGVVNDHDKVAAGFTAKAIPSRCGATFLLHNICTIRLL